jgi:phosphoglycolate phosphatase
MANLKQANSKASLHEIGLIRRPLTATPKRRNVSLKLRPIMSLQTPLIVFDLDGTLADTAGDLLATLNHILTGEGLPTVNDADARRMVGLGARVLIRRGFESAGETVAPARLEELFHAFLRHYEENIAVHTRLFPGVEQALDRFEAAGFAFAVCTNKIELPSVKLLKALGVADRFRAICGQDTFAWWKPDPRALLSTIDRAGGAPARAVMVGDSKTDIDTAKAAHVPVVAVDFGYTEVHVRELGPDRVISHFDALWDAVAELSPALAG